MKHLQFTKRWLAKTETKEILLLFTSWRIWITVFALAAIIFVPLRSRDFLGGTFDSYITSPLFWAWANFDGEHYLAIASNGYEKLNHSFFPGYPIFIKLLSLPFGESMTLLTVLGLIVSNLFFLASLFIFWKLIRLDYTTGVARLALILLVVFPTSFYFGCLYTESLFLFLVLASFYQARKANWIVAGILGGIASATRIVGILLLPALLVELWQQGKIRETKSLFPLALVPTGMIVYMLFLNQTTGNSLAFHDELVIFGAQREGYLVLLPQVFYRYVNMLLTVNRADPLYFTVIMELLISILSLILLIAGYLKKVRLSYLLFALLAYLLPTFTGSFSSLPRYTLAVFPFFIIIALFLRGRKKMRYAAYVLFVTLLFIQTVLFVRGYWVA